MRKVSIVVASVAGAIAAYLFDPDNGRGRRARALDQTTAALDSLKGRTAAQARHQRNVVEGWAHEIRAAMQPPRQFDDGTLIQKVRSEVIGAWTAQGHPPVEVESSDGHVTLTTVESDRELVEDLLARVTSVEGVVDARYRPGTPPSS